MSFKVFLNEMGSVGSINKQPDPIDMQINALQKKISDTQLQINKYREQINQLKQRKQKV